MDNIFRYKKIKRRQKFKSAETECNSFQDHQSVEINKSETIGPTVIKNVLSSKRKLFLSLLIFRVLNSLINQTSYVPDEYWQSTEVAHKWIFNIGYLTWEWLPEIAIRSPLYPMLFAVPFKLLFELGIDHRILVIKLPMVIHGCLAAVADYSLYEFSLQQSGQRVAQWVLFSQLVNWFTFYSCSRTLINNIEWLLVAMAMRQCHTGGHRHGGSVSWSLLVLGALCGVLRPTGLVVLGPLIVREILLAASAVTTHYHDNRARNGMSARLVLSLCKCLVVGAIAMCISLLIEKHFYGIWTCSQWNFIHFNVLTDVSQLYGVHPWHWYVTNALPAMLGTQCVPLLIALGTESFNGGSRWMIGLIAWVVYVYSCLGHKEFRFIFPILPIAMHLIGCALSRLSSLQKPILIVLLVTQLPMMFYMCLIHQRGGNDVIMSIGRQLDQNQLSATNTSLVFLMPCHSSPWYSHLHYNVSARFLTCEPQITGGLSLLDKESVKSYLTGYDESDRFYEDPRKWLLAEYAVISNRPAFWVMFEQLGIELDDFLIQWDYRLCRRFFHAHFPTHRKHSTRVVVFCRLGVSL